MKKDSEEIERNNMGTFYDEQAAIYDKSRVLFEKGYAGKKEREMISSFIKGSTILECGVGTGRNALYFGEESTYYGCDLSINMIKICKEKVKNNHLDVNLVLANAENLAFKEDIFDNIICSRTLKLLNSPLSFLRESRRVLKKGGRCIVTFSSLDSFFCRVYYNKIGSKVNKGEIFHFTRDIISLFKEAGFSNIQIKQVINVPWGLYQALWSFIIFPSQQNSIWQPNIDNKLWYFLVHFKPLTFILHYLNPILEKIAVILDGIIKSKFIILVMGESDS